MSTSKSTSSSFPSELERASPEQKAKLLRLLQKRARLEQRNKIATYYPDKGPLRRELYPKHLEFFEAGATHRERLFLAANRVGKTEGVGAYECALHLTGLYPSWWRGHRFDRAISAWAAGDTGETTRDIIQLRLLGAIGEFGTGMIPGDTLVATTAKSGLAGAVKTIYVRHVSGGRSEISLKSYDQKRTSFQGTNKDLIWLDEECDRNIYVECLIRTMTTGGILLLTFTPLQGMTDIIRDFLLKVEEK